MNTLKPLSPIKPVGSPTSDTEARQQARQQESRPGQTITASVLESAGRNRFYLSIHEQKILAQSNTTSLSPGTILKLQVLATTPLIELKIISDTPRQSFGHTVTLLGKNLDINGLFQPLPPSSVLPVNTAATSSQERLRTLNNLQQYPVGNQDGGTVLKQLIDRLGLSLETLLTKGDSQNGAERLNSALMEISALLNDAETLAETSNRVLKSLELYNVAHLKLKSKNQLIYSLPLPFLNHGYLLVEKNQTSKSMKGHDSLLRCSLHLTLPPLGNMEIHFLQDSEGLSLQLACESEEIKLFISEYQEDLKNSISTTDLLDISFSDTAGNPANDLIQQLIAEEESRLDTKV